MSATRRFLALATMVVATAAAFAGDDDAAKDWRAEAARMHLTAVETERLAKDKVLVAGDEVEQCFEPYIGSSVPAFVTSDSVLNAYHVLLEECVVRAERARAVRLPSVLRPMWDGLAAAESHFDLPKDLRDDAMRRARVLVGTALRVMTGELPAGAPPDVAALVETEAARVLAAKERLRPAWLGAPDPGFPFVDYTRCEPRSFYVRDRRLAAYFRAVAWLQSVPLRLDREPEFVAALMLGEAVASTTQEGSTQPYEDFVDAWQSMLGRHGDLPLPVGGRYADRPCTRAEMAKAAALRLEEWTARSLVPVDPARGIESSFRVLPAAMLPDAALLDRCCAPTATPSHPTGLYVAATLGGTFARDEALRGRPAEERERLLREFDAMRPHLRDDRAGARRPDEDEGVIPHRIYLRYLSCLATLLDPPDPAAPPLFGGEAWQAKATNTTLAGWAQMRHTWVLQARESAMYGSAESNVAGFVEPNPRFFSRFADLVAATSSLLERAGAFDPSLDRREVAWVMEDCAAVLRGPHRDVAERDLPHEERTAVRVAAWMLEHVGLVKGRVTTTLGADWTAKQLAAIDEALRVLGSDAPLPPKYAEIVEGWTPRFQATWLHLERTARRIEALAQKQLRGAPWDEDEAEFLRDYGHTLARAMLYFGNSYASPRDDAPRATSVHAWFDPGGGSAEFLHAAIARPRLLWVLYPWQGRDVLCLGTVLPYREFVRSERLTDAAWRTLLDTPDAPPPPSWWSRVAEPVRKRKE